MVTVLKFPTSSLFIYFVFFFVFFLEKQVLLIDKRYARSMLC